MKVISTKVHGMLDYLTGLVLVVLPWAFGFSDHSAASWLPVALGLMAMVYSLFTDYELGLVKLLPVPVHLVLDLLSGVLLAASPWIFGFAGRVRLPHIILGLFEVAASLMTQKTPYKTK